MFSFLKYRFCWNGNQIQKMNFPGIPGMPGAMPGQPMQPFHPMVGAWPGQAVRKIQNIQIWNFDENTALLSLTSIRVWA